jgi:hypothetical protein
MQTVKIHLEMEKSPGRSLLWAVLGQLAVRLSAKLIQVTYLEDGNEVTDTIIDDLRKDDSVKDGQFNL